MPANAATAVGLTEWEAVSLKPPCGAIRVFRGIPRISPQGGSIRATLAKAAQERLRPLRGRCFIRFAVRGCRFAQPPANSLNPFGVLLLPQRLVYNDEIGCLGFPNRLHSHAGGSSLYTSPADPKTPSFRHGLPESRA